MKDLKVFAEGNEELFKEMHHILNWQHKQCKDPRPNPVSKTLFVDHVCEPRENVPLPLPIENNLEDCLSLSLSTGNSFQVRYVLLEAIDYPCLAKKMFFPILDELKSTVTDLGQSHMCHTQWFAHYCCLTLHEGSSPMSMDFHPTWQTILPFGTCVGDIGPPWDVSSREKLLLRNFRVWNLDAGPMALKMRLLLDYALLFQPY
ncbi:unnamed protein product [Prunus armeniaca]